LISVAPNVFSPRTSTATLKRWRVTPKRIASVFSRLAAGVEKTNRHVRCRIPLEDADDLPSDSLQADDEERRWGRLGDVGDGKGPEQVAPDARKYSWQEDQAVGIGHPLDSCEVVDTTDPVESLLEQREELAEALGCP
jgi:hypothetical protein